MTICATLGVDVLDVVNMRLWGDGHGPAEGSLAEQFSTLAELQRQGLIRHLGVSNVTAAQVEEARGIAPVVCVQNLYNIARREDDALIDDLAEKGIAYVPFFPLGGFTPLQSSTLSEVASALRATPMQVALAWLLQRCAEHFADSRYIVIGALARESGGGKPCASTRVAGEVEFARRLICVT